MFICTICGRDYVKARSDEEALAELQKNFPGITAEDCQVVCDECYTKILFMDYDFPSNAVN